MPLSQKSKSFSGLFIFKIGGQEFCLDLKEIINVVKIPDGEINFNSSDAGLEYEGDKYKIISFDKLYKLNFKSSSSARIILTAIKKKLIGFFVDEIIEFLALDENSTKISRVRCDGNPFIKTIIKFDQRELIMPDFERIYSVLNIN